MVCLDEIGPAHTGVKPDRDDPDHDQVRKRHLWGNLMAGGAGCEWYFGYRYSHNDLNCEDWRSRDRLWDQTRYALEFFHQHLPFTEMRSADELTKAAGDYCFAKPGHIYAVYLPDGGTTEVYLAGAKYRVRWYNPRTGGALQAGAVAEVSGPGFQSIGLPPADPKQDWVALVELDGPPPQQIDMPKLPLPPNDADMANVAVESFTIIDAKTNRPLKGHQQVRGEVTIDLATVRSNGLNVVANVAGGEAGSVRFRLNDNSNHRTENSAPFALAGDHDGRFDAWRPTAGTYTVTATPYAGSNGQGAKGQATTLKLQITQHNR
jgi:hypothetical protein